MNIGVVGIGRREQLEQQICSLAGRIAAATCEWLVMIAEFDRNEWWAVWGCCPARTG